MSEGLGSFTFIERQAQRVLLAGARALHPQIRIGGSWVRQGWQLTRDELASRSLTRLAGNINHFRKLGLLQPNYPSAPQALADLAELPILTRTQLYEFYPKMVAIYRNHRHVTEHSSGASTGQKVKFFHSKQERLYSIGMLIELMSMLGWRPGIPRLCLWGTPAQLVGSPVATKLRRLHLFRAVTNMSAGPPEFRQLLDLIEANAPCAVYGFSSSFRIMVDWMQAEGIPLPAGQVICAWSSAELMDPLLPPRFSQVFGCKLHNLYGSTEAPGLAAECPHGTLHINPRYIIETVSADTSQPVTQGEPGQLLITDLFSRTTPYIRYRIGDLGAVAWQDCPCGRRGYTLTQLVGRESEEVVLLSGKRMNSMQFNAILRPHPAIQHYLAVRQGPEKFEMRYVGRPLTPEEELELHGVVQSELEGANVTIRQVESLPVAPSGKLIRYIDES